MNSFSWWERKGGWRELRWERNALQSSSTHCNHLHCWIRWTCHRRTRSTLTVYWRSWRVSLLGGGRKCLLMPGLVVRPWQRHQFVDTCCCWSWIPLASCINSTNMSRGKGGFSKTLLLCRASAQICMVSASGTLVKRLEMSKEQWKTEVGEKVKFLTSSTKVKESDTQLADRPCRTVWRRRVSHLASQMIPFELMAVHFQRNFQPL